MTTESAPPDPRRVVLTTTRTVLTTWLDGDADALADLHSDPETMRFVRNGRNVSALVVGSRQRDGGLGSVLVFERHKPDTLHNPTIASSGRRQPDLDGRGVSGQQGGKLDDGSDDEHRWSVNGRRHQQHQIQGSYPHGGVGRRP